MGSNLIDLRQAQGLSLGDLPGLYAYLSQLIGQPFQFARVSYGDELTLHFGDLRFGRSQKLKNKPYGAFILGVRGSSWVLDSGSEPVMITAEGAPAAGLPPFGKPLRKEELEAGGFIEPGSRVYAATPFVVKPVNGFGLQLRMSDGSTLLVLPAPPEPEEAEDEELPPLADWELSSPRGLLTAGPGTEWTFTPRKETSSERRIKPQGVEDLAAGPDE